MEGNTEVNVGIFHSGLFFVWCIFLAGGLVSYDQHDFPPYRLSPAEQVVVPAFCPVHRLRFFLSSRCQGWNECKRTAVPKGLAGCLFFPPMSPDDNALDNVNFSVHANFGFEQNVFFPVFEKHATNKKK